MFKVTPNGPNRIDLELESQIDNQEMITALDDLEKAAESIENGRMLYRVHNFRLPTLGALGVELSRLPALLRLIRKFKRCAVLADEKWVRAIGEFEGALIPGLDIKGFEPGDEAVAEAWLAEA
ncbi:MAG: STAS/SEC14 domain-containing protein [Cyanobacteria bacterium P01_H01_bin.15]